jgi:hypothetical protein
VVVIDELAAEREEFSADAGAAATLLEFSGRLLG